MAKIRVNKTTNYTIMSNVFLRDKRLSLKAKGLLALMFSLPEEWNYSVDGLTTLSADGKDSIATAITELEKYGYLIRTQAKDNNGKFAGYVYDVYEEPQTEIPFTENPSTVKPITENRPQINTYIINKEEVNKEDKHTHPYNSPKSQDTKIDNSYGLQEFLQDNPQIRVDNYNGIIDDMNFAELTRRIRESSWLQQVEDFSFFCFKYNKIISGGYKDIDKKEKQRKQGNDGEEEQPKRKYYYNCVRC